MKRTKVIDALQSTTYGQDICVKGWVRSKRGSKGIFFIALNDGSTIKNVQIVGEDQNFDADTIKRITTGACLSVIGTLVESPASGQSSEIQAPVVMRLTVSVSKFWSSPTICMFLIVEPSLRAIKNMPLLPRFERTQPFTHISAS